MSKKKTIPKYGNKAYKMNIEQIQKANSTPSAQKEIKRIKKELSKMFKLKKATLILNL